MLILQDVSFLQLLLWIAAGLILLSVGRIFSLSRQNRRLRKDNPKMENWAIAQQAELTSIHHDAQSWRAKTQRQFDALRTELSARLEQSERGNQYLLKQAIDAWEKALASEQAKVAELDARLAQSADCIVSAAAAIPALPAMETLRVESLLSQLDEVRDEAEAQRQQNADLQRSLLMARRKQPARRNGSRVPRHG